MFSITGGPRFSLLTGPVETYVGAAGGYYRDMSGQMEDDGAGFNAGGGLAFEVAPNTTLGVFGRYDYANMVARPGSDVARQWASTGITVQHVFQAEEAPPPAPPPPPPPPPPAPKRRIVLRGVNFDFDKSNIRPDARAILDEAVATLAERAGHPRLGRGPHRRDRHRRLQPGAVGAPRRLPSPTTCRGAGSRAAA